jgi:acetyltransferase-like isoleucine patch superfamily enzyme
MLKKLVAILCVVLPSSPTRFLYRLCGWRIGRNVRIPVLSYVYADEISIGNDACVRRLVYIKVRKLSLGANTIISYGTQLKGKASLSCGDNSFFGVHCIIHCAEDVSLGYYSGLGPRCTIYTHGSFLPVTMGYPAKFAPVVIEDFVWIAMAVTIMPGAHIERNCIINPGVVVQGHVRSNSIIQQDTAQYQIHDLVRLQKLSRKSVPYYHEKIVSSFLESCSIPFRHEPDLLSHRLPNGRVFISCPEANSIELRLNDHTKIVYDLEHFYADPSRDSLHLAFLDHIRLHFGLTLRTRYRT